MSACLDLETVGRGDVFQVDAAEGGRDAHHGVDELVGVFRVHLDVEDVDTGKMLEQHRLAFHHRLARQRPGITQPQHRGPVGDHRHQVALRGIAVGLLGILGDAPHRFRHARRVGQGQVLLEAVGLVTSTLIFPGTGSAWYSRAAWLMSASKSLLMLSIRRMKKGATKAPPCGCRDRDQRA